VSAILTASSGGFTGIVWTNENCRPAEFDIDELDRAEILNSQASNFHAGVQTAMVIVAVEM